MKYGSIYTMITKLEKSDMDQVIEFYLKRGFVIEKEQIDEHTGHPELVMTFNA